MTRAVAPMREKLGRVLRNGERLHRGIDRVRIIARTPIWPMLAELTAKELASLWESEQPNPAPPPPATTRPASSLDPIGSNTGLSGTTGASAGTIPGLVHAVAEKQAWAAADGLIRWQR